MKYRVHHSTTSDDPAVIARAADHFARATAGLALDGADCFLSVGPDEDEDDS